MNICMHENKVYTGWHAHVSMPNDPSTHVLQVGQDLLRHALCSGMPSLAGRILRGLMAPPLGLAFAAIARGTPTEDDAMPPRALGVQESLRSCTLISGDPEMVACVEEWGRVHGGPGFAWEGLGAVEGSPLLAGKEISGTWEARSFFQKPLCAWGARSSREELSFWSRARSTSLLQALTRWGRGARLSVEALVSGWRARSPSELHTFGDQGRPSSARVPAPGGQGGMPARAARGPALCVSKTESHGPSESSSQQRLQAGHAASPFMRTSSPRTLGRVAFLARMLVMGFGEGQVKESEYRYEGRPHTRGACAA